MDILTVILIIAAAAAMGIMLQILLVKKRRGVKISLQDEQVIEDVLDDEKLHRFAVSNGSQRSVVLAAVRLYANGREIFDNGHHPSFKAHEENGGDVVKIDSRRVRDISHLLSENFLGTTVVKPGEKMTYSYYLDETPDRVDLTVRENEDIVIKLEPRFG